MTRIAIAIATRDRPAALARTLATLPAALPVVICDQSAVPSPAPRATVLHHPDLASLPAARNLLLRSAAVRAADWVLFLDDDVDLAADFLSQLRRCIAAQPAVVAWGPVVEGRSPARRRAHRLLQLGALRDPRRLTAGPADLPTRALFGCCFAVRAAAARATGFDDRRRGYALGEDFDFFLRLPGTKHFARLLRCHHREESQGRADPRARGQAKAAMLRWLARRHGARNPATLCHLGLALLAAAVAGTRAHERADLGGLLAGLNHDPFTP